MASRSAVMLLDTEARALLTRLGRLRPFVLLETMVPAAAVSTRGLLAVEQTLERERTGLRRDVHAFLAWLATDGDQVSAAAAQRRFTLLRLRFTAVLAQLDLFAEAITQRSEQPHGVWLAGLEVLADDALRPRRVSLEVPAVLCYLDRGPGAAIRRARTRLPGDVPNPVAIIRIPRERMVGHGIASSLVHEVGHQVAALLDLVPGLHRELEERGARSDEPQVWNLWSRWASEAVADLWSVGHVGVASTLGLIAVVSLPRPFVFRINRDGPHPTPWIRVHLSCALGRQLYPDPLWDRLLATWRALYPLASMPDAQRGLLERLAATAPACAQLLLSHAPEQLDGRMVADLLPVADRQPARLRRRWPSRPDDLRALPPTEAMAVLGQARMDDRLPPVDEGQHVDRLLVAWALRRALINEPPERRRSDAPGLPPAAAPGGPHLVPTPPALVGAAAGDRR